MFGAGLGLADDEDELDDEEAERKIHAKAKRNHRSSVRMQTVVRNSVHFKTREQREAIKAVVSKSFIFHALSPEKLEQVLDALVGPHEIQAGSEVITQGDMASDGGPGLYLIESGTLRAYAAEANVEHPGRHVFTYNKPGQTFGEMSLLHDCPRSATVISADDSSLWSLDKETFNSLVKEVSQQLRARLEKLMESVDLLQPLRPTQRKMLVNILEPRQYYKGDKIIIQGDDNKEVFVLEQGAAVASVSGVGRVKEYKPGDYFGELALQNQQARAADVIANATPTKCMVLDADILELLLSHSRHASKRSKDGGSTSAAAEEEEPESQQDDDDLMEDEEFERQNAIATNRPRRSSIIVESWLLDEDWIPPVHPKTDEQREHIRAAVGKSFVFQDLNEHELGQVLDAFQGPHDYQIGDEVIRQGASVSSDEPGLFILESGTLDVYVAPKSDVHPGDKVFTYSQTGQAFGELALLYNCPRSATVIASSVAVLWSISRDIFNKLVRGATEKARVKHEQCLASVDMLQCLTNAQRRRIADVLRPRHFRPGDTIISEGDLGDEFFIVSKGSAYACINGRRVKEYNIGDFFGELSLIKPYRRGADVIATAPTKLMVLDGATFNRILGGVSDELAEEAAQYDEFPHTNHDQSMPDSQPAVNFLEESAEEEDEDDEMEDSEFEEFLRSMKGRRCRAAVAAEGAITDAGFRPSVNAKTSQQRKQIKEAMASSFLFAALPLESLEQILDAFQGPDTVSSGTEVIKQGATVHGGEPGLFMLESGALDAYKDFQGVPHPGKIVHTYSEPGQHFGELALLYNCPRAATVVAREDSVLWWVDRDTFNYLVKGVAQTTRWRQEQFLASVDLLRSFDPEARAKLLDVLQQRTYRKGDTIIRQGDKGEELLILEIGYATASVDGKTVKEYKPGDYFGELALLNCSPRAATVVADSTPTRVLALDGASFRRLLGSLSSEFAKRALRYGGNLKASKHVANESEDESDEEVLAFAEMERIRKRHAAKGMRKAIRSERWIPDPSWSPPVYKKTAQQMKSIKAALAECFMFRSLPPQDFEQVINAFQGPQHFQRGALVIRQGKLVNRGEPGLYILERGSLDVHRAGEGEPYPGPKIFTYNRCGDIFGELALLHDCARAATVIAASDCVLWSIDRDTFNYCVKGAALSVGAHNRRFLDSVKLLKGLKSQEREKVADVMRVRIYKRGDRIIQRGMLGEEFYIVEEGIAFASLKGARLKEYGPGDYFGELALMRRQPRSADVIADATPTRVFVIDGNTFQRLLGPLNEILAARAREYGFALKNGDPGPAAKAEQLQGGNAMWCCTRPECHFWNLPHAVRCLKCGKDRKPEESPGPSNALALVPSAEIVGLSTFFPGGDLPEVTASGVELVPGGYEGNIVARYSQRQRDAGIVQGMSPLAPGESFQIIIRSRGTFGELGIGLAPKKDWRKSKDGAPPMANEAARGVTVVPSQGMVGWSLHEVGFHGDYGRWYLKGRCPGIQVSPPWERADVIDCGLTNDGRVYVCRNGERVAETQERWPMEHCFPTASLRSCGAELAIDLRNIDPKYAFNEGHHHHSPADMLKQMQATVLGSKVKKKRQGANAVAAADASMKPSFARWLGLWCSCQEIEFGPPG